MSEIHTGTCAPAGGPTGALGEDVVDDALTGLDVPLIDDANVALGSSTVVATVLSSEHHSVARSKYGRRPRVVAAHCAWLPTHTNRTGAATAAPPVVG